MRESDPKLLALSNASVFSRVVTAFLESPWESALSGATANAISRTVVSPMERVRLQLSVDATRYKGTVDCFRTIFREEGLKGFWRGNAINVYRIAPQGAVAFVTKDYFKELLGGSKPSSLDLALASMMSGCACMTAIYPLDMIRGQVTTNPGVYRGLWHGLTSVYRQAGFSGLYKGLWHANLWSISYYGMQFFTYDSLKRGYAWTMRDPSSPTTAAPQIGPGLGLFFGGIAGGVCTAFAYPFELIRRKLQVQGLKGRPVLYSGVADCGVKIVREQGVLGLYRGLGANLLKSPLNVAIIFGVYEGMMDVLLKGKEGKRK